MSTVIVNADDFGLNEHNSKAIALAFAEGLVTDTTMMANGEYYEEALILAKDQSFFDRIGIHLNLTEGEPLTEAIKRCPRFVTDGRFNKQYNRRLPLNKAEKTAIYLELTAQVEKLQDSGIAITHADSHHHIHTGVFVAPIVERVCQEHGINKMRLYRNLCSSSFFKRLAEKRFHRSLRRKGFHTTDYFAYVMDIDGFDVPDDTEILVHPDFNKDGRLIDRRGMAEGFPVGNPIPAYGKQPKIVLKGYSGL